MRIFPIETLKACRTRRGHAHPEMKFKNGTFERNDGPQVISHAVAIDATIAFAARWGLRVAYPLADCGAWSE
jgi:hypothetical protein